jgi:hypothetical protein
MTIVPGSQGDPHIVRYTRMAPDHPTVMDWTCDCTGYRMRKRCSHIQRAKADFCGWQQAVDGEDPIRDGEGGLCCPRCGAGVVSRLWAG